MSSRLQGNSRIDQSWLRAHLAELAIFCLAVSLLFIKLGIGEFEDWDESHIVYRAQIIERFGAWFDQSPYALGGLYSSAHPPLGVWLMVASRAIFGETEFATRLPAALCGLIAAISMFFLLRRWCSDGTALLLSAGFAASSVFMWYSRHAQLDSLLIATSVLAITVFVNAIDKNSKRLASWSGVCFGLALLSKFGWAMYILPFVLGYFYLHREGNAPILYRFLGVGIALGLSWYVYMSVTNETFVRSVFGWLIGLSTVANYETGEKSPVYYFNQLILACPFIVFAVLGFVRRDSWTKERVVSLLWLAAVMIVLQLSVTKFPHFALMLLPPAFLVSAQGIGKNEKLKWWQWAMFGVAVLWSLSTQFRLLARGVEFEYLMPQWEITIPFAIVLAILIALQLRRRTHALALLTGLAGLIVIVAATRVIGYPNDLYNDGAKHVANTLLPRENVKQIVVVHSGLPFDSLTPRLAYYTKGWTSGWQEGRGTSKLGWTDASLLRDLEMKANNDAAIILERERDRFATPIEKAMPAYPIVVSILKQKYQYRDSLRSYDLFYN